METTGIRSQTKRGGDGVSTTASGSNGRSKENVVVKRKEFPEHFEDEFPAPFSPDVGSQRGKPLLPNVYGTQQERRPNSARELFPRYSQQLPTSDRVVSIQQVRRTLHEMNGSPQSCSAVQPINEVHDGQLEVDTEVCPPSTSTPLKDKLEHRKCKVFRDKNKLFKQFEGFFHNEFVRLPKERIDAAEYRNLKAELEKEITIRRTSFMEEVQVTSSVMGAPVPSPRHFRKRTRREAKESKLLEHESYDHIFGVATPAEVDLPWLGKNPDLKTAFHAQTPYNLYIQGDLVYPEAKTCHTVVCELEDPNISAALKKYYKQQRKVHHTFWRIEFAPACPKYLMSIAFHKNLLKNTEGYQVKVYAATDGRNEDKDCARVSLLFNDIKPLRYVASLLTELGDNDAGVILPQDRIRVTLLGGSNIEYLADTKQFKLVYHKAAGKLMKYQILESPVKMDGKPKALAIDAILTATDRVQAENDVYEINPALLVDQSILRMMDQQFEPEPVPQKSFPQDSFKEEWIKRWNEKVVPLMKQKAIVVSGPSGCGKTAFVTAMCPNALYIRNTEMLKAYTDQPIIVYDEAHIENWSTEETIIMLDVRNKAYFNVKNSHVTVEAGTPRILTTRKTRSTFLPKIKGSNGVEERMAEVRRLEMFVIPKGQTLYKQCDVPFKKSTEINVIDFGPTETAADTSTSQSSSEFDPDTQLRLRNADTSSFHLNNPLFPSQIQPTPLRIYGGVDDMYTTDDDSDQEIEKFTSQKNRKYKISKTNRVGKGGRS